MSDLISVITPAYNARECIRAAVESVLGQTYTAWEMIIVADDDQDYQQILGTHNIVDRRLRFYSTGQRQSGPNFSRNIGLDAAHGNYIATLDADDIYYPDRLQQLLNGAQETGLSLGNVVTASGTDFEKKAEALTMAPGHFFFENYKKCLVPLVFFFNRDLIRSGWDVDVTRGSDTLFNLRAMEEAGYAIYMDNAVYEYRIHNQSLCHMPGSEVAFADAYRHALTRLESDGLGFRDAGFRQKVIGMLLEKEAINAEFAEAVQNGYGGNYQDFVAKR
jgi:glycosyltransferase involved in cell wall biosynthesis